MRDVIGWSLADEGFAVTAALRVVELAGAPHHPGVPAAMRKRAVWVEPLFGEAKDWHGLRRFRLRGLAKVNSEALLVAAGQNLKHWLTATAGSGAPHAAGISPSLRLRVGRSSARRRTRVFRRLLPW